MDQSTKVYAFGSNGSGQLGIGHTDDTSSPQLVIGVQPSSRNLRIACGGNHSIFMVDQQSLASTGDNSDGRCFALTDRQTGQLSPSTFATSRGQIDGPRWKHVAATWTASIAVCGQGKVWTCGTGASGELGLGDSVSIASEPTQIADFPPAGTSIVGLASCMAHVVAVLSNGEGWGWGKARKGQLGEPSEKVWTPRKIDGVPFAVVDAVCGKDFTCLFGDPSGGQILVLGPTGNDRFGVRKNAPDSVRGWKQVAATWGSILVLSEQGELTGWGRNDHGQLPPADLPLFESFAAGSEHCLGLTRSGKVLAWGWGEHGNCGLPTDTNGDVKERWNEIDTFEPVAAVFAGCATSFMMTKAP